MRALVIQNHADAGLGLLAGLLDSEGVALTRVMAPEAELDVIAPDQADLFIVLGSPNAVYERDRLPWIEAEIALLRRLVAADRMVFGVCFGAQALASALGATVRPTGSRHCGWQRLISVDGTPLWEGPWFRWHGDTFDLPAGARALSWAGELVQAFEYGRHLGVAFHPEVDAETIRLWTRQGTADLLTAGLEPDRFVVEAVKGVSLAEANRRALVRAVLDRARR